MTPFTVPALHDIRHRQPLNMQEPLTRGGGYLVPRGDGNGPFLETTPEAAQERIIA